MNSRSQYIIAHGKNTRWDASIYVFGNKNIIKVILPKLQAHIGFTFKFTTISAYAVKKQVTSLDEIKSMAKEHIQASLVERSSY